MSDIQSLSIEQDIVNAILERPYHFTIEGVRDLYIYPKTLGKSMLISEMLKETGISNSLLSSDPYTGYLNFCKTHKDLACRIIAIYAAKDKAQLFNDKWMSKVTESIASLEFSDITKLFVLLFPDGEIERFSEHLGINKDRKLRNKAIKAKNSSNIVTFGGKSIYGTLIDGACKRYGWTFDYVVWGISYTNLMMLMSDTIDTVYLSDDERKSVGNCIGVIDMDDPKNKYIIKNMTWD